MSKLIKLVLTPCLLLAVVAGTALSQSSTATLSGTVVDANGAAVPGASVTLSNTATGFERKIVTDDEGSFFIPLLQPANYTLTVARDGFASAQVENVILNVGDQRALRVELKVSPIKDEVIVTADPLLVRTDGSVGTIVDRQFVENIPLNGRSFQSLITLTPGVVVVPSNTGISGPFSINGQRANSNYFMVDGVSANVANGVQSAAPGHAVSGTLTGFTADGGTNSLVSIDALQEFKIETSTYSAEFGRQPGGQISFVTRAGTNDFHGSLFDYLRNDVFDANDWFANRASQPRPPERQNDFGATFGGPVFLPRFGEGGSRFYNGRNRTFFFFSYEGLRLRTPKFALTHVPSLALRQAAPEGLKPVLNAFPLPNGRDLGTGFAEFSASYSDSSSLDATSVRIDQIIGSRLTVFGRVNKAPSNSTTRSPSNLAGLSSSDQDILTLTMGATFAATSKITNELRANYTINKGTLSNTLNAFGGAVPFERSAVIPPQFDSEAAEGLFVLFIGGRSAFADIARLQSTQRQLNVVNNFAYNTGSHKLKFGIDYRRLTPFVQPQSYLLGAIFLSQADVLNNVSRSSSVSVVASFKPIYTNFSAFGQDTWMLTRRLTLSLGLRWELNPPPGEADSNYPLSVLGLENLATADLAPQGAPLWKTTYNNFAPRLSFAYQLSQEQGKETLVRGGFGVYYDIGSDQGSQGFAGFPFKPRRNIPVLSFPLNPAQVAPPPFNSLTPPYGQIFTFEPNLKLPYTLQWNLAVERAVGNDQTLSASYVGAAGRRLLLQRRLTVSGINSKFTQLNIFENGATSDYHALQLQFQRRLSRGLQALASYTWAHAIDESSTDFEDNILTRGNSDFDIRHNFSAAVTYDLPMPKTNAFADAVLRGWSVDSRINAQPALPLNITAGTFIDPIDGTLRLRRANLIQGVPLYLFGSQYPGGRILNNTIPTPAQVTAAGCLSTGPAKGAFCTPLPGQLGTLGRNVVRGLPSWQVDMALRRRFKLTEKVGLQFRAEAFNLFNHPNFGRINTNLADTLRFGEATNMLGRQLGGQNALYQVGGPRSFQFALKLLF